MKNNSYDLWRQDDKNKIVDINDDLAFTLARVSVKDTKLPYDILIDSLGKRRNTEMNIPKLYVLAGDEWVVSVSIEENPHVLDGSEIPEEFQKVKKWILKYLDILLKLNFQNDVTENEIGVYCECFGNPKVMFEYILRKSLEISDDYPAEDEIKDKLWWIVTG